MFAIEIDFLTGRYTAHSPSGYGTREWPPHPGRLYSALVAAYHEHDHGKAEREALELLEQLSAPKMRVPEAYNRDTVTVYVPHYDHAQIVQKGGRAELIPEYRASSNKARTYPTVLPEGPVSFIWEYDLSEETQTALSQLANSVPYLGDSSSFVHATVESDPPDPNFVPANNRPSEEEIRVPGPGRLAELEQAYENGQRPQPTGMVGYTSDVPGRQEDTAVHGSDFGTDENILILEIIDGPKPSIEVAIDLTAAVRRAILAIVDDPIPTWISGHTEDGEPAEQIHVPFLPLGNIGHHWADGSILGVAVVIPDGISAREKRTLFKAIDDLRPVGVGSRGDVELRRIARPTKESLKRRPYMEASTLWTTVTPYVFDRYPDSDQDRDEMIAQACTHIGLPHPEVVHVIESGVSPLTGVPNAHDVQLANTRFAEYPRCHVILQFSDPVQGPITIGRGRFVGIGLMRNLKRGERQ